MAGFIQVPPDSTGKQVDAVPLTDAGGTVYRQKIVMTGGSGTAEVVVVTNAAPAAGDMGFVVRQAGTVNVAMASGSFDISSMPAVNISTMPAVVIAAGTSNIGSINNISATVTVAGSINISTMPSVVLAAGAANIGSINNISRTVAVICSTPFIIQGISKTVQVAIATPFTINNISAAVVLAAGANNIGSINNISATVNVAFAGGISLAAGTSNIGFINNISATVVTGLSYVIEKTSNSQVQVGDSANAAIRVNVVAGSSGGVSQVDGTTFSTQAANFVPMGGIFDDASTDTLSENDAGVVRLTTNRGMHVNLRTDGGAKMEDSANSALRVNIVAGGGSGGTSQIDGTTFSTQAALFTPVGGIFDDATPDTLSENDAGIVRLTTNRAFHVNIRDAAGAALGDTSATGLFVRTASVQLIAGTSNIGSINNISATLSTVLAAGTANIGSINNISATVTVAGTVILGAGATNIGSINNISATVTVAGSVNISTMPAVVLAAGTANIGSINNISAPVAVTGNFSATSTVVIAAGTANIGSINNISATVVVSGTVLLGAATANIGTINNISAAVVIAAGSNNIGSINNISANVSIVNLSNESAPAATASGSSVRPWSDRFGRNVSILNHPSILPSASHGPKCVTCSTSAGVALIAAPGAGLCVYITKIACTNGSASLTRADVFLASATASCTAQMYMAASGGGFTMDYNPPIKTLSNTGVTCRVKPSVSQAIFNVHFYVGAK